jgi:hypothetical protein
MDRKNRNSLLAGPGLKMSSVLAPKNQTQGSSTSAAPNRWLHLAFAPFDSRDKALRP